MKKALLILGAGGHSSVVTDVAKLQGYSSIFYLDDKKNSQDDNQIIGTCCEVNKYLKDHDIFVGFGNNEVRKYWITYLKNQNASIITLIHPSAILGSNVKIKEGTIIMANAVIQANTIIEEGCIINTAATIDHDCTLQKFTHICPGVHIAGGVEIKESCWIGIGSSIIQQICIEKEITVGAGAVVVENLIEKGTYVGVPAKKVIR